MLCSRFLRRSNEFRQLLRHASSVSLTPSSSNGSQSVLRHKVDVAVENYEDIIGIKAVKAAQSEVMAWEKKLSEAQLIRRDKQAEIKSVQSRLKEIHFDLDRTSRGEDKYLHLLTEEHAAIKKERALLEEFESLENAEREAFYQLSNCVRASHEKERERVEKTKWWSVSASLIGALIGIIGASIGNELRMRKIREMLPVGSRNMAEMAKAINEQNDKITNFISDIGKILQPSAEVSNSSAIHSNVSGDSFEKVLKSMTDENARLSKQMDELTRLVKMEATLNADPNSVVYIGSEMENLLEQTERNIESKMKLQTLLSVVFLYAALGVTIPLVFAFIRGN